MIPTKNEVKNGILAQINQGAVASLIDQLAEVAVENAALKERIAQLEAAAKPSAASTD